LSVSGAAAGLSPPIKSQHRPFVALVQAAGDISLIDIIKAVAPSPPPPMDGIDPSAAAPSAPTNKTIKMLMLPYDISRAARATSTN
jgi:hypothetical protein